MIKTLISLLLTYSKEEITWTWTKAYTLYVTHKKHLLEIKFLRLLS